MLCNTSIRYKDITYLRLKVVLACLGFISGAKCKYDSKKVFRCNYYFCVFEHSNAQDIASAGEGGEVVIRIHKRKVGSWIMKPAVGSIAGGRPKRFQDGIYIDMQFTKLINKLFKRTDFFICSINNDIMGYTALILYNTFPAVYDIMNVN